MEVEPLMLRTRSNSPLTHSPKDFRNAATLRVILFAVRAINKPGRSWNNGVENALEHAATIASELAQQECIENDGFANNI